MFVCFQVHVWACRESEKKTLWSLSVLPLCESQGQNSGHQDWWCQVLLFTEISCWTSTFFILKTLSPKLELTDWARLDYRQVQSVLLSQPTERWDYQCIPTSGFLSEHRGPKPRSWCKPRIHRTQTQIHSKLFTLRATSWAASVISQSLLCSCNFH